MTSSRTQAFVLLAAALLCGGVGGYALKSLDHADDRPRGFEGRGWMRGMDLSPEQVDTINAIWRRNEKAISELTEARIGAQTDSLWEIIHPTWDSLYGSIRLSVDSIRNRTRAETRAALPETLRAKYDSIVAVADSSRRRELEQRNATGRRGGPGRDGPPGPGGQGRGGPGRGAGGPPGGSGHGPY